MDEVEYWRWRYRDPETGLVRETATWLTAEQAAKYPGAERIEGTLVRGEPPAFGFDDTLPDIGPV